MREDFAAIAEYSKERHRKRVSKNPERLEYALQKLHEAGFAAERINRETTQIVVRVRLSGKCFVYYAGTGTVQGYPTKRGINNFIQLLRDHCWAESVRRWGLHGR